MANEQPHPASVEGRRFQTVEPKILCVAYRIYTIFNLYTRNKISMQGEAGTASAVRLGPCGLDPIEHVQSRPRRMRAHDGGRLLGVLIDDRRDNALVFGNGVFEPVPLEETT